MAQEETSYKNNNSDQGVDLITNIKKSELDLPYCIGVHHEMARFDLVDEPCDDGRGQGL